MKSFLGKQREKSNNDVLSSEFTVNIKEERKHQLQVQIVDCTFKCFLERICIIVNKLFLKQNVACVIVFVI